MEYTWYYLIIINALGLFFMHYDKKSAKANRQRVAETDLIGIALLFGSLGILMGMIMFRHKTKKTLFSFLMPVLPVLQTLFLVFVL